MREDDLEQADGTERAEGDVDRRRPRSVYDVGSEPDPRFTLANERTALAWIRTGLSLIAGGVALTSLATIVVLPRMFDFIAAFACFIGGVFAVNALRTWARAERAMRQGHPMPAPSALFWLVGGVGFLSLILLAYSVARIFA